MALVAGWLEKEPALDQLKSPDTALISTWSISSESESACMRRCQRRHRARRLAPIPTGRSSRPGSMVSRILLSFVKHVVIPAVDFCELNCMQRTLEVAILSAFLCWVALQAMGNKPRGVIAAPFVMKVAVRSVSQTKMVQSLT